MRLSQILKFNYIILFFLLLLFIANKEFLRPAYSQTPFISVILGSLPNLIGAFMFSLFRFDHALLIGNPNGKKIMYNSSFFIFLVLTSEEFYPVLTASKTFDYYDILFSALGSISAITYYNYFSSKIIKS